MVSDPHSSNILVKQNLRERFRVATLGYLRTSNAAKKIVENLQAILPRDATIAAFKAKNDEANLDTLFSSKHYNFVFPRMAGENLEFFQILGPDAFVVGGLGILEPDPNQSKKIDLKDVAVALVPGVAFDRKGNRLGRGRGHYDRALKNFKGLKIGVASVVQIANDDLPSEPHDVAMDMIVTDQFVLRRFDS